jgi:hypothetical protein
MRGGEFGEGGGVRGGVGWEIWRGYHAYLLCCITMCCVQVVSTLVVGCAGLTSTLDGPSAFPQASRPRPRGRWLLWLL